MPLPASATMATASGTRFRSRAPRMKSRRSIWLHQCPGGRLLIWDRQTGTPVDEVFSARLAVAARGPGRVRHGPSCCAAASACKAPAVKAMKSATGRRCAAAGRRRTSRSAMAATPRSGSATGFDGASARALTRCQADEEPRRHRVWRHLARGRATMRRARTLTPGGSIAGRGFAESLRVPGQHAKTQPCSASASGVVGNCTV